MSRRVFVVGLFASVFLLGASHAAEEVAVDAKASLDSLWTDAIHYFKVARPEYGEAYLKAFLDRKPGPEAVLKLSDADPQAAATLIKLQSDPKVGKLAGEILKLIDQGWNEQRRDVKRIDGELDRLAGTERARFHALQRLKESGEYAIPPMVRYLSDESKSALHAQIIEAAVALGPAAIEGLVAAVQYVPGKAKLLLIEALARMDYPQSLPYLKEIADDAKEMLSVRDSAKKAIESILQRNPKYRVEGGAGRLFLLLAERYYREDTAVQPPLPARTLTADVRLDRPNIWLWKDGQLACQPVPWEIYYDLMAMRLSRRALELDGSLDQALTLWLLADTRRELRLAEQVTDPLHSDDFPSHGYFLRAAGTDYCLAALKRAIDDHNVAIALTVLDALTDVAGGKDILKPLGEVQPIVAALNSPHQLIQLRAALALGWAAPKEPFGGSDRVVPLLGKVIVGPGKPLAAIVVPNKENAEKLKALAEGQGYEAAVFAGADAWQKEAANLANRTELMVVSYDLGTPGIELFLQQVRRNALLRLAPKLIITPLEKLPDAAVVLKDRSDLDVVPGLPDQDQFRKQVAAINQRLGRIVLSEKDGLKLALSATEALRRLAEFNVPQFDVTKATAELAQGALAKEWDLARDCSNVLAMIDPAAAQQALAQAALARTEEKEKVALLGLLTNSIRRFGGKIAPAEIAAVQKIVLEDKRTATGQAAAAVMGALSRPPQEARAVILTQEKFGAGGP